jgi:MFS family permease
MQVMQMAFAVGFFLAAVDNLVLGAIGWRWVLAVGVVPGFLSLAILRLVPEPDRWRTARARGGVSGGTFAAIFAPDLRRRTIVGTLVATAMMIGSWGGITLLPSWIQQLVQTAGESSATGVRVVSYAFMIMMAGAAAGYVTLIWLTNSVGRRASYFLFCAGALVSSLYLFTSVTRLGELLWFMPVYGYFAIGGFGTFALYLPELFPTRVRATGQGFCWNAARSVTAVGPLTVGFLVAAFNSYPAAALTTTVAYLIGLIAICFGPETRGRPLPD